MTRGPFTYRVRVVTALQRRREAEGDSIRFLPPPILTRRTFPKPAPFTVHDSQTPFQESTEISGNAAKGSGAPVLTITLSTLRNFGVDNGAMAFRFAQEARKNRDLESRLHELLRS